ncbi:MAG: hypothetical protein ABS68_00305 [Niastella sp. SCN 39-18]|nr:hypothetical protein [Sphingobacteriales bacterium]ODT55193.1 MAG: hypothetical protein ABS68_00305 [Niastella sp. SCN 39-18]OJW09095.1 MAG: hypothetical protein BGO53_00100 [Sphingobacteriales bacterium 39-19]
MARTIKEIHAELLQKVADDAVLTTVLYSSSQTAIYRLYLYIVAFCAWSTETIYDLAKVEINETISAMKPHSLRWYAERAKMFQFGFDLVDEADYYDNTDIPEDTVNESKIVSYAAVVEQSRGIRIKVAKTVGADLGPLSTPEVDAFTRYIKEIKDAGVKALITSGPADNLKLQLVIVYDPLVLDGTGARLDGSNSMPVKTAIKEHLKNLPFNGVFSVQKLVDAIQLVDGVDDLQLQTVQTKYGLLPFTSCGISVIPDAGYLRIDDADLTITYQT